jgi:hypothetical protein
LKLNFSKIIHPKRRALGRGSWVPSTEYQQHVKIGQVIYADKNSVQFIATVGKREIGLSTFEYEMPSPGDGSEADVRDESDTEDTELFGQGYWRFPGCFERGWFIWKIATLSEIVSLGNTE